MTKNIDQLTAMVNKVTLKQEQEHPGESEEVGNKRKKLELYDAVSLDPAMDDDGIRPDDMFSSMELDESPILNGFASLQQAMPSPVRSSVPFARENSVNTQVSDNEFVDQLF
jgi:hypothetical protein